MPFKYRNIDEAKKELKKKIKIIHNNSKSISSALKKSTSEDKIKTTLEIENEIITLISRKAKLKKATKISWLPFSFKLILQFYQSLEVGVTFLEDEPSDVVTLT